MIKVKRTTSARARKRGYHRVRVTYPIGLSLSYDAEVKARWNRPTARGGLSLTFDGRDFETFGALLVEMHRQHLVRTNKRGSHRYRPPEEKLLVHVAYDEGEYGIPLPEFNRASRREPLFCEVRSNRCLRRHRLGVREEGGDANSPHYSRMQDLRDFKNYGPTEVVNPRAQAHVQPRPRSILPLEDQVHDPESDDDDHDHRDMDEGDLVDEVWRELGSSSGESEDSDSEAEGIAYTGEETASDVDDEEEEVHGTFTVNTGQVWTHARVLSTAFTNPVYNLTASSFALHPVQHRVTNPVPILSRLNPFRNRTVCTPPVIPSPSILVTDSKKILGPCRGCCEAIDCTPEGLHFKRYGECGICLADSEKTLWNPVSDRPANLFDLPSGSNIDDTRLPDDVVFSNPCGIDAHLVCVKCFRTVALDRNNPPVNRKTAALHCVSVSSHANQRCQSVYDLRCFAWVLSHEERLEMSNLYDRYRFPGYEVLRCQSHYSDGQQDLVCNAECLITYSEVDNGQPGRVIVMCTQNPRCMSRFCYHCRTTVPRDDIHCQRCVMLGERNTPEMHNRYFYNPDHLECESKGAETASSHLLKNKDVTVEVAVKQIEEVFSMDKVMPRCNRCGHYMYKTVMCNTMTHCGVEKCYMCGRTSVVGGHLELNHWDPSGRTGCPRYDNHPYWGVLRPKFMCQEGICYGESEDCTISTHQGGIKAMHDERKVWHVWAMIRSLSDAKRHEVMGMLEADNGRKSAERSKILARLRASFSKNT